MAGHSAVVSVSLAAILCGALESATAAGPSDGFRELRTPLFGLSIEQHREKKLYRLMARRGKSGGEVVLEGSLEECEEALIKTLERRYGRGLPNLQISTLGGKQFWADQFIHCGWRIQENVYTGHFRLLDPDDVRQAWGGYEACRVAFEKVRIARKIRRRSDHLVLLVHGLFRSKDSLKKLAGELKKAGYEVESVSYPSTRRSIREHVDQLERILGSTEEIRKVSFVAHSLGGLVVRELLGRKPEWKKRIAVHRLVMIGTPNRGSTVADVLKDWLPYQLVAGDAGQEVTPASVARVPVPTCSFGNIAGGTGTARGFNPLLPGDNDGTVLVRSVHLPGERDFLRVRTLHSFLMSDDRVVRATVRFLQAEKF